MPKQHYKNKKYQNTGLSLKKPLEYRLVRASAMGLFTFLVTFLACSAFAPVEVTDATGQVLAALDAVDSSVSISSSQEIINLSLATGSAGTVRTASDVVNVTAGSNGYQLYIGTTGNVNALIRDGATTTGTDSTTGLPTYAVNDLIPASTITDINNPAALTNDTWGFAVLSKNTTSGSGSEDVVTNGFDSTYPTGDSSLATSKFIAVPAHGNDILVAKRSSATTIEGGTPTNFYYGIRATSAKPSGLYKNTITYTAIGDSNANGLASVSPERTNQLAGGITITIATPSTATLSSLGTITATVGGQTCANPVAYNNPSSALVNVTCTTPALATGWHSVVVNFAGAGETYVVNPGIEYYSDEDTVVGMQSFSIANCNSMRQGETVNVKDARDGKVYTAAKMGDGNCWMTTNLRLGATNQDITLTSADSDIPDTANDFVIPSSAVQTSGTTAWSNTNDVHVYSFATNTDDSSTEAQTYGNLYNWYTATAGTTASSTDVATASICPKGWTLPTNNNDNTVINAIRATGVILDMNTTSGTSTSIVENALYTPFRLALAGYYNAGATGQTSSGYYWTASSADSTNANNWYVTTAGNFSFQGNTAAKTNGYAVRCVLNTVTPGTTMQEYASDAGEACKQLGALAQLTLTDSRDSNTYVMTRQADGNCWMTTNLRLGTTSNSDPLATANQSITLTKDNSDFPPDKANYTIALSDIQNKDTTNTNWQTIDDWQANHVYSFAATANANTYGNLYNWYTATAGTGLHSTFPTSTDATASICPKGWQLPPNTGDGSFTKLMQSTSTTSSISTGTSGTNAAYVAALQAAPLSFVLSGNYNSSPVFQGVSGSYWSRTSHSSNTDHSMYLYFNTSNSGFYLQNDNNKFGGFAVRCVLVPARS